MKTKRTSLNDIAKALNVSKATVSFEYSFKTESTMRSKRSSAVSSFNLIISFNSGTPIKISLESNSLFSVQMKTLIGTHLDYKINNFGVVLNMTVSEIQAKLNFNKFQSITQKFLDVNLKYLGHVNSSQRIRNSIISRTPLMSKNNKNSDTKYFENISQALSRLDSNNTGSIKFFD